MNQTRRPEAVFPKESIGCDIFVSTARGICGVYIVVLSILSSVGVISVGIIYGIRLCGVGSGVGGVVVCLCPGITDDWSWSIDRLSRVEIGV